MCMHSSEWFPVYCLLFTELVQLIVSRSDSELEVQVYSTKNNTLTVDPSMSEDELFMRQHVKSSPNCGNRTVETEFSVFEF